MPGTTLNGMLCCASTSSSSPPRPKIKGSPPLRRTTLAALRLLQQQLVDLFLRHAVMALLTHEEALGIAPHRLRIGSDTSRSYTTTSACWIACNPFSVSRPASPGPAPTSTTSPCCASKQGIDLCGSASPLASVWANRSLAKKRSQKARRGAMALKCCFTRSRSEPASAASSPRCWGSIASSFSRSRRASTGARPPEETAIISGERSTIDGIMALACCGASTGYRRGGAARRRQPPAD